MTIARLMILGLLVSAGLQTQAGGNDPENTCGTYADGMNSARLMKQDFRNGAQETKGALEIRLNGDQVLSVHNHLARLEAALKMAQAASIKDPALKAQLEKEARDICDVGVGF